MGCSRDLLKQAHHSMVLRKESLLTSQTARYGWRHFSRSSCSRSYSSLKVSSRLPSESRWWNIQPTSCLHSGRLSACTKGSSITQDARGWFPHLRLLMAVCLNLLKISHDKPTNGWPLSTCSFHIIIIIY